MKQYVAGTYLNVGAPDQGLPVWTQANRSIDRQDLVLWYSCVFAMKAATHLMSRSLITTERIKH